MGAGKTTVAAALGHRIGWRAEDIDQRIEARERRSVTTIFSQDGEAYFRRAEREVLLDLLPERNVVVATGGGTFVDPDLRATMLNDGAVAWLDLPLNRVIERIPQGWPSAAGRRSRADGAAVHSPAPGVRGCPRANRRWHSRGRDRRETLGVDRLLVAAMWDT